MKRFCGLHEQFSEILIEQAPSQGPSSVPSINILDKENMPQLELLTLQRANRYSCVLKPNPLFYSLLESGVKTCTIQRQKPKAYPAKYNLLNQCFTEFLINAKPLPHHGRPARQELRVLPDADTNLNLHQPTLAGLIESRRPQP